MVPFDMPLDAKLALAKMSVIYEREVGNKIRMSRDEDIVSLINFAVDSFNEEIIRYLDVFTKLLGPSEIRQLVAQGANIYRGAVVPEGGVSAEPAPAKSGDTVHMYRGVPVAGGKPPKQTTGTQGEAGKEQRSKRVYRGRVIDD
jgi:hypothetical protein